MAGGPGRTGLAYPKRSGYEKAILAERRMTERLRLGHYSWRTEQTYRKWARRLAHFLKGRGLESATE